MPRSNASPLERDLVDGAESDCPLSSGVLFTFANPGLFRIRERLVP